MIEDAEAPADSDESVDSDSPVPTKENNVAEITTGDDVAGKFTSKIKVAAKTVLAQQRINNAIAPVKPPRRLGLFMNLPDREKFPAYYDMISKPLDINIIRKKAINAKYVSVGTSVTTCRHCFSMPGLQLDVVR